MNREDSENTVLQLFFFVIHFFQHLVNGRNTQTDGVSLFHSLGDISRIREFILEQTFRLLVLSL